MNALKFSEWVKLREMAPTPGVDPNQPGSLSPAAKTAQAGVAKTLQQMPLKPGENPLDVLKDPKRQKDLLSQTVQKAGQQGKMMNLGAAAAALDPMAAATGA